MLNDFFKLNEPFIKFDEEKLKEHLKTSQDIRNVLYEPTLLGSLKISNVTITNVSFSKTFIDKVTFSDCHFIDCLFIGTIFKSVEFHDCYFDNCNFFKSKFENVYAKPHQFRKAIKEGKYSNIAVHLYQQLRENYYRNSQKEFKNEAEYFFAHWNRKNEFNQARRKKKNLIKYVPSHVLSWLYGYLFGYGYRVRNLVITTFSMLIIAIVANHIYAEYLFPKSKIITIPKSIYFTITTMSTLGASGYDPDTNVGYGFVIGNVLFGIGILSATISAIFKKVIR
jgi:hypothetical protein